MIKLKLPTDDGIFKDKSFKSFSFSVIASKSLLFRLLKLFENLFLAETVMFSGISSIVMFRVEFLKRFDRFAKILSNATFWVFSITTGIAFKIGGSNGLLAITKYHQLKYFL